MPRPSKEAHPLHKLRKILGKTQAKFASMVGVQAITIKRIEGDSLDMSKRLARRIEEATGAESRELLKGRAGRLLNPLGEPYEKADFDYWERSSRQSVDAQAKERAADLSFWLGIVLEAAAAAGHAKFKGASEVLAETLNAVVADFRLEAHVKAALKPHATILPHPDQTFRVETHFNAFARKPAAGPWQLMKSVTDPRLTPSPPPADSATT